MNFPYNCNEYKRISVKKLQKTYPPVTLLLTIMLNSLKPQFSMSSAFFNSTSRPAPPINVFTKNFLVSLRASLNLIKTFKELQLKMPKPGNTEYKDKIKILCLHGYRQNADSFKSKIGSFRKIVNKYAEFTFLSAPLVAPPIDENSEVSEEQRSWWFNKDDNTFKGTNQNGPAYGK